MEQAARVRLTAAVAVLNPANTDPWDSDYEPGCDNLPWHIGMRLFESRISGDFWFDLLLATTRRCPISQMPGVWTIGGGLYYE